MKRFVLLVVAVVAINYVYPEAFAPVRNAAEGLLTAISGKKASTSTKWVSVPKTFSFTDVAGQTHRFSNDTNKPAVVAFWIDECGYSQNAMLVLNAIRREYPAEKLDVIGFFLNPRTDGEVVAAAQHEGYSATQVAAQPYGASQSVPLIKTLHEGFGIRGPGRDIYVIDSKGFIHTIPTVDAKDEKRVTEEVIIKVDDVLKKVLSRV